MSKTIVIAALSAWMLSAVAPAQACVQPKPFYCYGLLQRGTGPVTKPFDADGPPVECLGPPLIDEP